jgi:D-alanyl-D-alanine carboxypeptidase
MKPTLLGAAVALALLAIPTLAETYGAPPPDLKAHLDRLVAAYPQTIAGVEGNDLVLKDGTRLAISDGRTDKSFEELLNAPDVDDMFAFPYPAGAAAAAPPENHDPGRVRVEALFKVIYGDCKAGKLKLRDVAWVPRLKGGKLGFHTAYGADKALEAASRELQALPKRFHKYLKPSAGTFVCRSIANSNRRSMHAYGIAIDINTKFTTYWEWDKKAGKVEWKNQIPMEIVNVFEKHGFIWGGRWYHYDTMHFEYRPEFVAPGN